MNPSNDPAGSTPDNEQQTNSPQAPDPSDERLFRDLVQEHSARLQRFIVRHIGNTSEAEENDRFKHAGRPCALMSASGLGQPTREGKDPATEFSISLVLRAGRVAGNNAALFNCHTMKLLTRFRAEFGNPEPEQKPQRKWRKSLSQRRRVMPNGAMQLDQNRPLFEQINKGMRRV